MFRFSTATGLIRGSLALSSAILFITGCSNSTNSSVSFVPLGVRCEAPSTSAEYGVNPGPILIYPTNTTWVSSSLNVRGTCITGQSVTIQVDGMPSTTAPCLAGNFQSTMQITSPDGSIQISASQNTGANNAAITDTLCFMKNTVPPAVTISINTTGNTSIVTGSSIPSVNILPTSVSGACETDLPVVVSSADLSSPVTTTCTTAGNYTASIQLDTDQGTKTLTATQVDPAGNQGQASTTFLYDTQPPVVQITSPIPVVTNKSSLAISGICETGLAVQLGVPGATVAKPVGCDNGTFTATEPLLGPDGPYTVAVFQEDAAGNIGRDSKSLLKDTTPPTVTITSPVANSYLPKNSTFSGACESGLNVQLSGSVLTAPQSVTCNNSAWTLSTSITSVQGSQTLIASQTDAAGNVGTAQQTYIVDTIPPTITITSPAANSYLGSTFTLVGACESGITVQLSGAGIASTASTSCTSGAYSVLLTTSANDGSKVVTATQTDPAGNVGSATQTYLRDTVPPVLTISSPASGAYVPAAITVTGTCQPGLSVTFAGSNVTTSTTVACNAGGTYTAGLTLSGSDGSKTITGSETDPAGNTSSASVTINKDTTPPVVTITSPAPNTEAGASITVGGTCESGLNVVLAGSGVGTPVTTPCTSSAYSASVTFTSGSGSKPVTATQTDLAGNVGTASSTFISDVTAPAITITSPAANSYLPTTFTLQGACQTGLQVSISGAGIASTATAACTSGAYSASLTVSANDGTKVVTATQTDTFGNVGTATQTYLRLTTPPVLTISSPANGTTGQYGIQITGTCQTGLTVNFSGTGVSAPSSTTCVSGGYQAGITFSSPDGSKSVTVTETDPAGNTSQVIGTFNRDTTPPAITITSPAANTPAQNGLTVGGTCESGLTVTLAGTGVATPVSVSCTNGVYSGAIVFNAPDGPKPVTASQTDAVGNTGTATQTFVRDTTPPAVTITSPTANSYLTGNTTFSGACETGLTVQLSGSVLTSTQSVTCTNSAWTLPSAAITSSQGSQTLVASQTDAAGNVGTAQQTYIVDTVAPVLTITSPATGSNITNSTVTLVGTCETGLNVAVTGGVTSTSGSCNSGAFSIPITFTTGFGSKTVQVQQTDPAGNVGQASAQYNYVANSATESFTSTASSGRIDILFVDDNSSSMGPMQSALGTKFASFATAMTNIDWQIGITTTDCSTDKWGICGSLVDLTGTQTNMLTPSYPNAATVFETSIERPETVDCEAGLDPCPTSDTQPLLASLTAMTKYNSNNSGFFRSNSSLAIVILSDSDECQTDGSSTCINRPSQLISTFNSIWPSGKNLSVYSIGIMPGDVACLNQMNSASGGSSYYAPIIDQAVTLTNGTENSICSTDFSVPLQNIAQSIWTLTSSVTLANTPIAGSVSVTFTPNQTITSTVNGNQVIFNPPPSAGTKIQVTYQY